MKFDLPALNIAEVTLIGTGGGYGESIVVHIGDNKWIVVDSCIDPKTKTSLPLAYLKQIGVNVDADVKLILCTHWHDDHILGLSSLLSECSTATFSMARPNDLKKFLRLIKLDYTKSKSKISNSSTVEFNKCLDIIETRNAVLKHASSDKVLYSQKFNGFTNQIISLSPSDYTLQQFDAEISTLITEFGRSSMKIVSKSPNAKSVAIFVKLGDHRVILGADLEVSIDNDKEGWVHILDNNQVIDKGSGLFKIPHHGSENGYYSRIWNELLLSKPTSKLTPWNKKNKLPQDDMLKKYASHTNNLFMTSSLKEPTPKKRDNKIQKAIKSMNLKITEVKYEPGIIRNRINMNDVDANWNTDLYERAYHVNPTL